MEDLKKINFDIIVVAGQSNAEGMGISFDFKDRIVYKDQFEMVDANRYYFDEQGNVCMTLPIKTKIRNLQERKIDGRFFADFSIKFVEDYIKNGYLAKDRKVLVIKAAVGGTGFIKKQHGVGNFLYERLLTMVNEALSYNRKNRIVAFLWDQGECDAYECPDKKPSEIYNFYKNEFIKQMNDFKKRYSNNDFSIIACGFCNSWANLKENKERTEAVEKALIDSCRVLRNASFIKTNDLESNSDSGIDKSDNIHFSRKSQHILGHRIFERWEILKNKKNIKFNKAKWIWAKNSLNKDDYAEFQTTFNTKEDCCILKIACDSVYAIYLNNKLITVMECADYPHYKYCDRIILRNLKDSNKLIIKCWHQGVGSYKYVEDSHGVIFEVVDLNNNILCYSNKDSKSRIMEEYKNGYNKIITIQQGLSFLYDCNYSNKKYDVSVIEKKEKNFHIRRIPILDFHQIEKYKSKTFKNYILIDVGREITGYPEFIIQSDADQKLLVSFGEHILDGGKVRQLIGNDRDFSFEVIVKKGINKFSNPLKRFGLRYLQINFSSPIRLKKFIFVESLLPQEEKHNIYADKTINDIYKLCVSTLKCCVHEHYEDCPWREQSMYALDSRNQMLLGNIVFDGIKVQRHNLVHIGQSVQHDGLLTITSPTCANLPIPCFSMFYVKAVREYIEYSGDVSILEEVDVTIKKIFNFFKTKIDSKYKLIPHLGKPYWNFYEWTKGSSFDSEIFGEYKCEGFDLILNCLYVLMVDDLNKIYNWKLDANDVKKAINKNFYNEKNGTYYLSTYNKDTSVLANSLVCLIGLGNDKLNKKLLTKEKMIDVSLSMIYFYYEALLQNSKNEKIVINDIKNKYKKMIKMGATTVFETEKGSEDFGGAGSMCHGWSALPIYYFEKLLK